MSMIRAGIDPLEARLMGRWKSWAMLEYLRQSSLETQAYAQQMLAAGAFTIPQHQTLPQDVHARVQPYID